MAENKDNKKYAREVKMRFLQEMDRILGSRDGKKEKVTAMEFGEVVGSLPGNLTRLRSSENNFVTIDMCCRLCENYGTSPAWLFMGEELTESLDNKVEIELRVKRLEDSVLSHNISISKILTHLFKKAKINDSKEKATKPAIVKERGRK